MASGVAQADIITFDFTGRVVVASSGGTILLNEDEFGTTRSYTPIAASFTFDTATGLASSALTLTMSDFWGYEATLHDISMHFQPGSNLVTGQVLIDWAGNTDMPLHVEWNATGLLNAVNFGLQVGDKLSGTHLYRDSNGDGVWDASEWVMDIGSATPYSDELQNQFTGPGSAYRSLQGPAPLAATSGSLGLGADTPFPGIRGYFDIGSGNSMYVTSVSAVPVPAAAWLLGSGMLALVGWARRGYACR